MMTRVVDVSIAVQGGVLDQFGLIRELTSCFVGFCVKTEDFSAGGLRFQLRMPVKRTL
jgi:hypothetical protein